MITGRSEEHLCLILQASERLAVDHTIAIALKRWTNGIFWFGPQTPASVCALRGLRREVLPLAFL
jgi:hypothetical protein